MWQVEILFKELKQTLQLQDFFGESENAVKWQIWAALFIINYDFFVIFGALPLDFTTQIMLSLKYIGNADRQTAKESNHEKDTPHFRFRAEYDLNVRRFSFYFHEGCAVAGQS